MTNFDRVKSLTLDEMASFLATSESVVCSYRPCMKSSCSECVKVFLEEDYIDQSF